MDGVSLQDDLGQLRSCPHCGLHSLLPPPVAGTSVHCSRCRSPFRQTRSLTYNHLLACSMAALVFYLIAISAPFINVMLYGRFQISTLWTGPEMLNHQHLPALAVVVMATTLILPLMELILVNIVLYSIRFEFTHPFITHAFRWVKKIAIWAMLEIYLLSFLVAYKRLSAMAYVYTDIAVYALFFTVICMALMDSELDSEDIWSKLWKSRRGKTFNALVPKNDLIGCDLCFQTSKQAEGTECLRCGHVLHARKKESLERSWALVIAAMICYIPANYFSVMNITEVGQTVSYTIIGGMMEFVHQGFLPLALLIFVASIFIPFAKMVLLIYLMISTHKKSAEHLMLRTKICRVIHFIGRWSMVDIFMASIMVALVQFGQIAHITAGLGGIFFCAVVILTMLAVESFDSRLMWDRAENSLMKAAQHA